MTLICMNAIISLILIYPYSIDDSFYFLKIDKIEEFITAESAEKLIKQFMDNKKMNCKLLPDGTEADDVRQRAPIKP